MTSVVYGILAFIATQAGLFGIWLGVLLFFSFWRYCYSVLLRVAQGHQRIQPPDIESFNPVGHWGVFCHLILFPGLVVAALLYPPVGFVIAILVAIVFPASAALMGMTSNVAHSLNAAAMLEFTRTVGSDYGKLVVGYLLILGGTFVVLMGPVPLLLGLVIENWAILASFGLIGSVLRTHRLQFEIPGEVVPREESALHRRHEQWHKVLDVAYASFRSDLYSAGYKTLHELVDENCDSLEVNHWLIDNMLEWQNKKYALEVAAKLMPRLIGSDDAAGALDLYRRCRHQDPEFRLSGPLAEQLAEHARAFGHPGLADELSYN